MNTNPNEGGERVLFSRALTNHFPERDWFAPEFIARPLPAYIPPSRRRAANDSIVEQPRGRA